MKDKQARAGSQLDSKAAKALLVDYNHSKLFGYQFLL